MKSLFNHWYAVLPAVFLAFASCSDIESGDDPAKEPEPPAPSGPSVKISEVTPGANTVSFTITPDEVAFYTYKIKSDSMTSDPVVCDPAEKKLPGMKSLSRHSHLKCLNLKYLMVKPLSLNTAIKK